MRRIRVIFQLFVIAASSVGCDTTRPDPYLITAPSSLTSSITSGLSRWDALEELREWVENPLTNGSWSTQLEPGVVFARGELRTGVSSRLHGPGLEPVFVGVRAVRLRVRFFPASASTTASLNSASAFVGWTGRSDPSNPLIPHYFARSTGPAGTWQVLELPPEPLKRFPPVVDARWLYLVFGRTGEVTVDVDWIELVR